MKIYTVLVLLFLVTVQDVRAQESPGTNETASAFDQTGPGTRPFTAVDIENSSFYQDTQKINLDDSARVSSSLRQISNQFGLIGKIVLLSNENDRSPREIAEYLLSSDKGIDFTLVGTPSGWHTAFRPVAGLNDQNWIDSIVPVIDGKFREGDKVGGLLLFVSEIEARVNAASNGNAAASAEIESRVSASSNGNAAASDTPLKNGVEDTATEEPDTNLMSDPEAQHNSEETSVLSSNASLLIGNILLLISVFFLFFGNRLPLIRSLGGTFATNPFRIVKGVVTKMSELEAVTSFRAYSTNQSHGYDSSTRYFLPLIKIGNTTLQNHKITREIYEHIDVGDECALLTRPTRLFWIAIILNKGEGSNALYERNPHIVWCRNVTQETESNPDLGLDKRANYAFRLGVAPNLAFVGLAAFCLTVLIIIIMAEVLNNQVTELVDLWVAMFPLPFAILCATLRASADVSYERFVEVVASARA